LRSHAYPRLPQLWHKKPGITVKEAPEQYDTRAIPEARLGLLECVQMKMTLKKTPFLAVCLASLLWIGCSDSPAPAAKKKEPEAPPEPATGQSAMFKMYQKARTWAADAQVFKVNSIHLADVPAPPGRSGAWQAAFTSASLGKMQTYTYSVVEEDNVHKGVFSLSVGSWSGSSGVNTAFDIRAASIDTVAAYETALKEAKDYDQKHPGMPISFQLEKINQFPVPVWRVIWGESVGTSSFSVYVDASQGKYLEKMH
jgi:hypothetical protein